MTAAERIPLTPSEEITLRRVAHGQSDIARLPAADLVRLRALRLVHGSPRVPRLTVEGRRRFDGLAKPFAPASFDVESELTALVGRLMGRAALGPPRRPAARKGSRRMKPRAVPSDGSP